jgi:hypothetical protein
MQSHLGKAQIDCDDAQAAMVAAACEYHGALGPLSIAMTRQPRWWPRPADYLRVCGLAGEQSVLLGPVEWQIEFGETRCGERDGLPTLQARLDVDLQGALEHTGATDKLKVAEALRGTNLTSSPAAACFPGQSSSTTRAAGSTCR